MSGRYCFKVFIFTDVELSIMLQSYLKGIRINTVCKKNSNFASKSCNKRYENRNYYSNGEGV